MKLRTTVGKLLEAFTITSPTLDKKGTASNLYLNANELSKSLYLYSTNLLCETATRFSVEEIEMPGEVLINPSKLKDGLQGLPKDTPITLSLNKEGTRLKASAGNVNLSLAVSSGAKEMGNRMRGIPKADVPANATIPTTELSEFASRTEFCLPNDETGQRASLSVLKLTAKDNEEAFATDGSIAVCVSSTKKQGKGTGLDALLIPTVALHSLRAILAKRKKGETIDIITTKNKVYFRCAEGTHLGALIPVIQYPDVKRVLNQTTKYSFEISRELFKQSLVRADSFLSSDTNKKVLELEFDAENLILKASGEENLTDFISISYKDDKPTESVKIGMNINYLTSIAAGSKSETLTFGFATEDKPLIVTDTTELDTDEQINVKYVIMGIKLNGAKQKVPKVPDNVDGN